MVGGKGAPRRRKLGKGRSKREPLARATGRMIEGLEARQLLAAVTWDGGGDGATWTNALNWSNDLVPTSADDVTISIAANPTITISTGTQSIRSLVSDESLVLSGGTLSVAAASQINAAFTLSGSATLAGAGQITFASTLSWTAGTMTGAGRTIIAPAGVLNMTTSTKFLARTIQNDGTATWSGGLWVNNVGRFENNGTFTTNPASGTLTSRGDSGANAFINAGTFTKTGAGETQFITNLAAVAFSNSGTVNVEQGTLDMAAGGTQTGDFTVAAAALVSFAGTHGLNADVAISGDGGLRVGGPFTHAGTVDIGGQASFTSGAANFNGTFDGGSSLSVSGGTANFNSATTFAPGATFAVSAGTANLGASHFTFASGSISSGTLTGSGDVTVSGVLNWTGGAMVGAGKTIIAATTGTLNMSVSTKTLGRIIQNDGAATWTGGLWINTTGRFENNGSFTTNAGSGVLLTSRGDSGVNAFINTGTFTKTGAGETQFTLNLTAVSFSNSGSVAVDGGTLSLETGGTQTKDFTVAAGAVLAFSGTHNLGADVDITGAGGLRVTGGVFTHAGTVNIGGAAAFSAGTSHFNGAFTAGPSLTVGGVVNFNGATSFAAGATLSVTGGTANLGPSNYTFGSGTISAGTLSGSGDVTVTGELDWSGGGMTGTGKTIIPVGASLDMTGSTKTLGRIVQNDGTATWNLGFLLMTSGRFDNNGTFTTSPAVSIGLTSRGESGTNVFNNTGTFTKLGAGETQFIFNITGVAFNNSGTVAVDAGTLGLEANGTQTSDFTIAAGATLGFDGGHTLSADVDITGAGNLFVSGGTLTDAGTVNIGGSSSFTGGTATFNGPYTGGSSLSVSGTVNFNGVTSFPATATLAVTSGTANLGPSNHSFASGTLSGGALSGAGEVTFTGALNWSGGTMSGAGKTIVAATTGTLNLTGTSKSLSRVLRNDGAATWTGGTMLNHTGRFENNGSFTANVGAGGTLTSRGDSGTNVFINTGTFTKIGAGEAQFIVNVTGVAFSNSGTVNVNAGSLGLEAGGAQTDDFLVAAGATLRFAGTHSLSADADISGDGNLSVSGGSLTDAGTVSIGGSASFSLGTAHFNGPFSGGPSLSVTGGIVNFNGATSFLPTATFLISAGTANLGPSNLTFASGHLASGILSGSGEVTVTGLLTWTGGDMIGAGKTVIAAGTGTLNISGSSSKDLARVIQNDGTATWTGGQWINRSGRFDNNGSFTANAGSAVLLRSRGDTGVNSFNNLGTFTKIGLGEVEFFFNSANVTFNNSGTVAVEAGVLALRSSGTHSKDFTLSSGAILVFDGTHSLGADADITGAGSFHVVGGSTTSAGTVNIDGSASFPAGTGTFNNTFAAGAINIGGGTANFNAAASATSGAISNGVLGGTGEVTFNGAVNWTSGAMSGSGTTTIANTGSITLGGTSNKNLSRLLLNQGTGTWTAGLLIMNSGRVNNNGTFTSNIASGSVQTRGDSGSNSFNNAGTFNKIGAGENSFSTNLTPVAFNNTGTVNVNAGTLALDAGGTHSSDFVIAGGATLRLAGTHNLSAEADITGAGNITVAGGSTTHSGTTDIGTAGFTGGTGLFNGASLSAANLNVNGGTANLSTTSSAAIGGGVLATGTLAGTAEVVFSGAVTWNATIMSGAGKTTIAPGASMSISGVNTRTLSRVLQNDGTATWTGGLWVMIGGRVDNNGSFVTNTPTAALQTRGDGGTNSFNNAGTYTKQGAGENLFTVNFAAVPFNNTGTVYIEGGTLAIEAGGSHSNDFVVSAGALLRVAGTNNLTADADISGAGGLSVVGGTTNHAGTVNIGGTASVNSGTANFTGPSFAAGNLNLTGGTANFSTAGSAGINGGTLTAGTLTGTAEVVFSGAVNWTASMMSGAGKTTIAEGASLALGGTNARTLSRVLQNDGNATWSNGLWIFINGRVDNNGSFTANAVPLLLQARGDGGTNTFNNFGTFTKTGAGELRVQTNLAPLAFNNTGTVTVNAGILSLESTVTQYQSATNTLSGGTWEVNDTASLNIPATTIRTNAANVKLSGSSSSFFALNSLNTNSGTLTLAGMKHFTPVAAGPTFTNSGNLNLGPGTRLAVPGAFTQTTGTIHTQIMGPGVGLEFGQVVANGAVTLDGALEAELFNNYDPNFTLSFAVVTGSSRSGTFSSFSGTPTPSGRPLRHRYNATSAIVGVAPLTPAGPPDLIATSDSGLLATDNITNVTTPTFTGAAEDGTTVRIYANDVEVGSGAVVAGQYSVAISTLLDGPYTIIVRAEDADPDLSDASAGLALVIDTLAPGLPSPADLDAASDSGMSNSDNITNDNTPTFDVSAPELVRLMAGSTVLLDYATPGSLTSPQLGDDTYQVLAHSIDVAGNLSAAAAGLTVTIDTLAPAAPAGVPDLQAGSDSGMSNSDNITNDSTPTFTVSAPELIRLMTGDTILADYAAPPDVTSAALVDETYQIVARSIDVAGNFSAATTPLNVTIDTLAPAAPAAAPDLQAASDSGLSNSDNITNDTTPTFTVAGPELIRLTAGAEILADYASPPDIAASLADGVYNIAAQSIDVAGNASAATAALVVTIDTIAPDAPALAPDLQAASDAGLSGTDNITNDTTPTFTIAGPELIRLLDGAVIAADYAAPPDIGITLGEGAHSISAQSIDVAGNTSASTTALVVTIDTIAPDAPTAAPDLQAASDSGRSNTDNITNDTTPTLTVAGPELIRILNGTMILADYATPTDIGVTLGEGLHTVTAQSIDVAGNTSAATAGLGITIDTVAPDAPTAADLAASSDSGISNTDNITNDTTPTFTVNGAELIRLLAGSTLLLDYATPPNLTSPALDDGVYQIIARSIDVAGNVSAPAAGLTITIDTLAPAPLPAAPDLVAASDSGFSSTDNITSDTTPTFAIGGPELIRLLNGTAILADYASPTNIEVSLGDGVHNVSAQSIDIAGNISSATTALTVTVDTLAPAAPTTADLLAASDSGVFDTDNITNDTTPTFTVAGPELIRLMAGAAVLADYATPGELTSPSLDDDTHQIVAHSIDLAGNVSASAPALAVTIDTLAPGAPAVPDLQAASDSGLSDADNITNDTTPTFTVSGPELIRLLSGSTILADYASPGSITSPALGNAAHDITARSVDAAGNVSAASTPLTITIDTIAPAPAAAPDLDAASDSGISSSDNITNDATPAFNLVAPELVRLVAGTTLLIDYATPGQVQTTLLHGVHELTAVSVDLAGNAAAPSTSLAVTIDTIAPAPSGSAPDLDAASDSGLSNTDNITNDDTPTLIASGPELIRLLDGTTVLADYAAPGSIGVALGHGNHEVVARSVDAAGNVSDAGAGLAITIDTIAPAAAATPDLHSASDSGLSNTDNITNDNTPTFTLLGSDLIRLMSGSVILADYAAPSDVTLMLMNDGEYELVTRSIDVAGNVSAASTPLAVTIDTLAPDAPSAPDLHAGSDSGLSSTDNITNDTTPTFSFTGPAMIRLFDGAVTLADYAALPDVTSSALLDGVHNITAQSIDLAGNTSAATAALPVRIDTVAPAVMNVVFNFETGQNLQFTFSEDVEEGLTEGDLILENLTSATTVPAGSISVAYAGQVGTFTFPGFANGILPDGNYRVVLDTDGVSDVAGNELAAHANYDFFSLIGDLNRDRQVSIADFITLASNFNSGGATWSDGDLNYDTVVSIADFIALAGRFNSSLPAPVMPLAQAAASEVVAMDVIEASVDDNKAKARGAGEKQKQRDSATSHSPSRRRPHHRRARPLARLRD